MKYKNLDFECFDQFTNLEWFNLSIWKIPKVKMWNISQTVI